MREDHHPRPESAGTTTTPRRSPAFDPNRNETPSISPLSTTDKPLHPAEIPSIPLQLDNGDQSDGSSSLSDYDAEFDDQDQKDDVKEADSEAETERLDNSPQKNWIASPSKLNQAAVNSDPRSSPGPRLQSPLPSRLDLLATTTLQDDAALSPSASPATLAGRKRKRPSPPSEADSPLSEHSDSEEALAPSLDKNKHHMPDSRQETPELIDNVDDNENENENPYISPMKAARLKRAKQKSKQAREPSPPLQRPHVEVEDEEVDPQQEGDEETRKRAHDGFAAIAEHFQTLRAKLHAERLASAEAELEQLNHSYPTHPDYLAMLQCITSRRDTKIQQEMRLHQYKLGSLRIQTLAERSQLHSQYFQDARETRDKFLEDLGQQWYDIQKERRQFQSDQQDNYSYKFPTKRSDQVRNQEKYNREVSILSGMAKYRGFPAAPDIHGARSAELDDDLKAMGIPRRQIPSQQPAQNYQNHNHVHPQPSTARTADERFHVEQTPWANPQHPIHHQSRTPGSFGGYGIHLQSNLLRQNSVQGQPSTNSPFSTPLPNSAKRNEYTQNGLGSNDTIGIPSDPPSSAAPQTNDRFPQGPAANDLSPIDQLKVRPAISNPLGHREVRRDFSGLSSASTIETPADPADAERHAFFPHHQGPAPNGLPPQLPHENSIPQQPFVTSALHTQNGKPDERRQELYENANFRRPQLGTFGTPVPLFGNGSPARQDGQKAS